VLSRGLALTGAGVLLGAATALLLTRFARQPAVPGPAPRAIRSLSAQPSPSWP